LNSGVGHIVSPNYPLPIQEPLECYYKIVVAQGSQIKLTILDIELITDPFSGGLCKDNFLEVCFIVNVYIYILNLQISTVFIFFLSNLRLF